MVRLVPSRDSVAPVGVGCAGAAVAPLGIPAASVMDRRLVLLRDCPRGCPSDCRSGRLGCSCVVESAELGARPVLLCVVLAAGAATLLWVSGAATSLLLVVGTATVLGAWLAVPC